MPHITSQAAPTFFGTPGYAIPMPMVDQSQFVRTVLSRERQQYDDTNNADFDLEYANEMPFLDTYISGSYARGQRQVSLPTLPNLGRLRGLRGTSAWQTLPQTYPDTYKRDVSYLDFDVGVDSGIYQMDPTQSGMGVVRLKPRTIPVPPQTVSLPHPQQVQSSTKALVVGGAALFVAASIGAYFFLKRKKGK